MQNVKIMAFLQFKFLHTQKKTSWWTWFHQVQHVPGTTSLLFLEQHFNHPIRFERQVYSLCQV